MVYSFEAAMQGYTKQGGELSSDRNVETARPFAPLGRNEESFGGSLGSRVHFTRKHGKKAAASSYTEALRARA